MPHYLKPRQDMLLGADHNLDPPEDSPECGMCGRALDDLGECSYCLAHDEPSKESFTEPIMRRQL